MGGVSNIVRNMQITEMPPLCPNFKPPKATHYCCYCNNGIYEGEQYIENDYGEYRHYDCFYGIRDLLDWLKYNVKTMGDTDGKD